MENRTVKEIQLDNLVHHLVRVENKIENIKWWKIVEKDDLIKNKNFIVTLIYQLYI